MLVLFGNDGCLYKTCPPQLLGVKTLRQNPSQCAWQEIYATLIGQRRSSVSKVSVVLSFGCKMSQNNLGKFNPIG
jgi:hypothetical protein